VVEAQVTTRRWAYGVVAGVAAVALACAEPGLSGAPGPAGNSSRAEYACKQLGKGVHAYKMDDSGKYFECRRGRNGKVLKTISYNG
jgi:hypothetical protein